ncbi:hypothetical protein COU89_01955, partial [Candidatus Roizmanbacteria bacterium CG10_big_fil_rev_8_21_14_0_10_45_7]
MNKKNIPLASLIAITLTVIFLILLINKNQLKQIYRSNAAIHSETEENQTEIFANNELKFIKSILPLYVNNVTTYGNLYNYVRNRPPLTISNSYYRAVCSLATLYGIDQKAHQQPILFNDRGFQMMYFNVTNKYNNDLHTDLFYLRHPLNPEFWISPAVGFDCLLAANVMREAMPNDDKLVLSNFAQLAYDLSSDDIDFTVEKYKKLQREDKGNGRGEEAGFDASYLTAAAELLPDESLEPFGQPEVVRNRFRKRAGELIGYAFSQCENDCPFTTNSYLMANHNMYPNALYTQSVMTSAAEIAMIYKQLNQEMPEVIRTNMPSQEKINKMLAALQGTMNDKFELDANQIKVISSSGQPIHPECKPPATYTVRNDDYSVFTIYHGVTDWGFDAAMQNSAYAYGYSINPDNSSIGYQRYQALQNQQLERKFDQHPYFPSRFSNGKWSYERMDSAQATDAVDYFGDGYLEFLHCLSPSTPMGQRSNSKERQINSHWWFNALQGKNHAVSYLLLTKTPMLGRFGLNSKVNFAVKYEGITNSKAELPEQETRVRVLRGSEVLKTSNVVLRRQNNTSIFTPSEPISVPMTTASLVNISVEIKHITSTLLTFTNVTLTAGSTASINTNGNNGTLYSGDANGLTTCENCSYGIVDSYDLN